MLEQTGAALTYDAFFTSGGVGKTGLAVTVNVYKPDWTPVVTGGSATEGAGGFYTYTFSGSTSIGGNYRVKFMTTDSTVDQKELPGLWIVGRTWVQDVDATISSRSTYAGGTVAGVASPVSLSPSQSFDNAGQTTALPVNVTKWLGSTPPTPNTAGVPKVDTVSIAGVPTSPYDGTASAVGANSVTLDAADGLRGFDLTGAVILMGGIFGKITASNTTTGVQTLSAGWNGATPAAGGYALYFQPGNLANGVITSAKFSLGTVNPAATGLLERLALLIMRFFPLPGGSVTSPKSGTGNLVITGTGGATVATQPVTDNGTTQTINPAS